MPLIVGASRGLIPATEAPGARATLLGARPSETAQIVRHAAQRAGFQQSQFNADQTGGAFTGRRRQQLLHVRVAEETNLLVRWRAMGEQQTLVEWTAYSQLSGHAGLAQPAAIDAFLAWFTGEVEAYFQRPPQPKLPVNPVVRPGEVPPPRYEGQLYDYSALTPERQLGGCLHGSLPIGRSAFGWPGATEYGPPLFLPDYDGRAREELGIVVCAPQGRGKTRLLLRWAAAAVRAGRSVFLVDVKGNLYAELEATLARERLPAPIMMFSTAAVDPSIRLNLLAGIEAQQPDCAEQLMLIAEILLPKAGYSGEAGLRHGIALRVLRGAMQLLKLLEFYELLDGPPRRRADLADLYTLIRLEPEVLRWIAYLRRCEPIWREVGREMAPYSVEECVAAMAIALGSYEWEEADVGGGVRTETFRHGQRPPDTTYEQYVIPMLLVLEAFRPSGYLGTRVRSFGAGEELRLDQFGLAGPPVIFLMSAREESSSLANVMLGLVMRRLRQELDKRRNLPARSRGEVLMLLDETARIVGFDGAEFVSIARENRVGYAFVYQDLSMIGEADRQAGKPDSAGKLLGNIGTLVFLHGIAGENLDRLNRLRAGRNRARQMQTGQSSSAAGSSRGFAEHAVDVPFLQPIAAEHLPAGRYPALVVLRDGPAFLVDLDEGN